MSEMGQYVKKGKETKSDLHEVMERRKSKKLQELEDAEIDAYIAEAKDKIKKASPDKLDANQTTNFAAMLFAGRKPEEIKEILSTLTQEEIDRVVYMAVNMNSNSLTNFRGFLKEPTTSAKEVLEAVKIGVEVAKKPSESGAYDLKGIAEIFNAGVNAAKASQPPPQNPQAGFEYMYDKFLKPIQETMNTQNQALLEAKIEAVKAQMPAPLETQIANLKAMAGQIGLGNSGSKSEFDLKIEDMRQRHDMDMETIRWEKEKFLLGKESDVEKWSNVKEMFSPVFAMPEVRDTIRKIGESVGKSIEGAGNPTKSPQATTPAQPQVTSFVCPECKTEIGIPIGKIPAEIQGIKCMKCGAVSSVPEELRKTPTEQESPSPPEEKPANVTRLKPIYR